MNAIEQLFKEKGIFKVGTYVYPKQVAMDFINTCKKTGINILGIDALIIQGEAVQPSMDNSIDFTTDTYIKNPYKNVWDTAIAFLNERDDIYYFEIVCDK